MVLRDERVQLQGSVFANALVLGNFQIQVSRQMAESWLDGSLVPGVGFDILLPEPAGTQVGCHPGDKCDNFPSCESCGPARM